MPQESRAVRASQLAGLLACVVLALGVVLRCAAFVRREAFWSDEAALALNILGCDFAELGRPFLYAQVAPYLFMAGQKLVSLTVGGGEPQLRAWSLLAGIALLPALYRVTERLADRASALAVLCSAASAPLLVHYSTELKPYAGDALIAVLLLGLSVRALAAAKGGLWPLAAAGVIAPWLSLPALFVLAGSGVALCAQLLARRERARFADWAVLAAIGGSWLCSFGLHYWAFLHQSSADAAYMQRYWTAEDGFTPRPLASLAALRWYAAKFCYLFSALVLSAGHGLRYVAGALWLFGLWHVWRSQPARLWLFIVPVAGMFAAATLHAYAFADRLALFLYPLLAIPCALGLTALVRQRTHAAWACLCAALALASAAQLQVVLARLQEPRSRSDIRSLVAYLHDHVGPADRLFVEARVEWIYAYYAFRDGIRARPSIVDALELEPNQLRRRLAAPPGTARVWAVVPAVGPHSLLDATAHNVVTRAQHQLVDALRQLGQPHHVYDGSNVRLYVYDLTTQARAP